MVSLSVTQTCVKVLNGTQETDSNKIKSPTGTDPFLIHRFLRVETPHPLCPVLRLSLTNTEKVQQPYYTAHGFTLIPLQLHHNAVFLNRRRLMSSETADLVS